MQIDKPRPCPCCALPMQVTRVDKREAIVHDQLVWECVVCRVAMTARKAEQKAEH